MFQPVEIEAQSEQEGWTHLHAQRTTRCACREFPFHGREQTFDLGAAPIDPLWKRTPHLRAHSVQVPVFSTSRGNRDLRSEVLADVGMIALAVELRVGQHPPDAGLFAGGFNDSRQILVIVERAQPHVGPTAGFWLPASAFCQDYACAVESSVWRTRPVGSRPTLTEVGMFVGRFLDKERKLVCSRACLLEDLIAWFARITCVKSLGFSAAVPLG